MNIETTPYDMDNTPDSHLMQEMHIEIEELKKEIERLKSLPGIDRIHELESLLELKKLDHKNVVKELRKVKAYSKSLEEELFWHNRG